MSTALDEAPAPPMRRARRRAPGGRVEGIFLLGTVFTTAVTATLVLRLWEARPRVPFVYTFDGYFDGLVIKGVLDHGWYLHNPAVGAPFGLRFHDFPLGGDNLQFVLIKALGLFSHDWALVMNAYFLLSFVLISATSYVVARQLGVGRGAALVLGTLFSFLPYHFSVGELLQSTYFAVPLGAFLVLDALGWDVWGPPFLARAGADRSDHRKVRWMVRGLFAAVIASAGTYYAPFTIVLVVAAAGLALLTRRDPRAILRAGVVILLIGAVVVVNAAPTLLYRRSHGTNAQVSVRVAGESDTFALHIVDLFLPTLHHRVPALAELKEKIYRWWPTSPIFPAPHVPLGALGATGLALSLCVALGSAVRPDGAPRSSTRVRLAGLGALNLVAILFGAATGFSSLLVLAGVTQVRVWSRISIFIGFFSLVAGALALQASWPRTRARLERSITRPAGVRRAAVALGVGALVLGILDQTQARVLPDFGKTRVVFQDDRQFVAAIERRLPPHAQVFQLPLISFPERPAVAGMYDYQLLRGYLHSTEVEWSYPAMRGRPTDWAWSMGGRTVETMLGDIAAAGFDGLYVDTDGFVDHAAALQQETSRLIGPPTIVSGRGTLLFWDLQPYADRQLAALGPQAVAARQTHVLHPVQRAWKEGFEPPVPDPPYVAFGDFLYYPEIPGQPAFTGRWAQSPATLELTNPLPVPRPVRLRFRAEAAGSARGSLTVSAPGMADVTVPVAPDPAPLEVSLVLPPGTSPVRITSSLPATISRSGAKAAFQIQNVTVVDVDDRRPEPRPA